MTIAPRAKAPASSNPGRPRAWSARSCSAPGWIGAITSPSPWGATAKASLIQEGASGLYPEIEVGGDVLAQAREAFRVVHVAAYGYRSDDEPVQIVPLKIV